MTDLEQTVFQLRAENQRLVEELSQAKSDKEFVWSLWKRLQVSSPDLTQAISLVVQREKEKAEIKDARVLQILQLKDQKIEELQSIVTKQSKELTSIIQQKSDLLDSVKRLEADVIAATERARQVNVQMMSRDSGAEERHRLAVEEYERQKSEASQQVSALQAEVTRVKTENGDINAHNIALESRAAQAERELVRARNELGLVQDDANARIEELERRLSHALSDADARNTEAVTAREELQKLLTRFETTQRQFDKQSALLSKMEAVEESKDTIIRSKDQVYTRAAEEMSNVIKRLEAENRDLRKGASKSPAARKAGAARRDGSRTRACKADVGLGDVSVDGSTEEDDEDDELTAALVSKLPRRIAEREDQAASPVVDMNYRVQRLEQQLHLLEDCLSRRETIIRTLRESGAGSGPKPGSRRYCSDAYVHHNRASRLRTHSAPMRSPRRCLPQETLQRQLTASEKMVADLENCVAERDEELISLRQAFDKRGQRIRSLKYALRRCRAELAEAAASKERDLGLRIADDQVATVVKELASLRDAYNDLISKNSKLSEEVIDLRNQSNHDDSKIRQLQQRSWLEREAVGLETRDRERLEEELDQAKRKNRLLEDQLCVVNRQNSSSISSFQAAWENERKGLRAEIENLAQELSSKRVEIASLNRNLRQLRDIGPDANKSNSAVATAAMADILDHFAAEEEEDEHNDADAVEDRLHPPQRASLAGDGHDSLTRQPPAPGASRRIRWSCGGRRAAGRPRRRPAVMEDLDSVPTRDGEPSSDSTRTRTEDSQSSGCPDPGVSQAAAVALRLPQSTILKRRLASLQQQLRAVRKAKKQSVVALSSLQTRSREMSRELDLANARARRLREALDRASRERGLSPNAMMNNSAVEQCREETGAAVVDDQSVEDEMSDAWSGDGGAQSTPGRSDKEWKTLIARARTSGQEVLRQAALLKQLREELVAKDSRLSELREKLSRVERDAAQKKSLLDECRAKVKAAQESAKADRDELEVNLQRLRESRELAERQRVQLDSFRRRLATVTDERRRYEADAISLRAEAERRSKQAGEAVAKRTELEKRLSAAEKASEEKLVQVARRSEGAVDAARAKLAQLQARLSRSSRLLLRLARAVDGRATEAKAAADVAASRRRRQRTDSDESMQAACERAADILQLSAADVAAILRPGPAEVRGGGGGGGWVRRWERLQASLGPADDDEAEALGCAFEERLAELAAAAAAGRG